jgi:transposase-like protein
MSKLLKRVRQIPSGTILPLHEVRHRAVADAIDKCGGNYMLAAKMLGMGRTTIYRWVRTHGHGCSEDQPAASQAATPGVGSESTSPAPD